MNREAAFIAEWIATDIAKSGRRPADFALLARQKIATFEARFRIELARYGIQVRNDDELVDTIRLQDLLKHEVARLILGLLRLADQPRGLPTVWQEVLNTLYRVHGAAGDEVAQRRVGDDLTAVTTAMRSWLASNPSTSTSAREILEQLLSLLDVGALHRYVRTTMPDEALRTVIRAFWARLDKVLPNSASWADVLEKFECADAVVLLTAHRSKGLEYHTVFFFMGLDDDQWWAHGRDPVESTSTFFVGVSRAAQRVILTTTSPHARTGRIATFFELLDEAASRSSTVGEIWQFRNDVAYPAPWRFRRCRGGTGVRPTPGKHRAVHPQSLRRAERRRRSDFFYCAARTRCCRG